MLRDEATGPLFFGAMNDIRVKDETVLRELMAAPFDPRLFDVVSHLLACSGRMVITSGYRKGDRGVHGTIPCRGLDVRSRIYADRAEAIAAAINRKFVYDPQRPHLKVAVLHGKGKNRHLHLQVHPATTLRAAGEKAKEPKQWKR